MSVQVLQGDCIQVMRALKDNSVDSIVTDPPAGIEFMGKKWDADHGGRRQWVEWLCGAMTEALRVLKPGGHALVWSLPRTSHWTAWALEDAGFEIRDCIMHIFGTGFPKSLDISKAIDKAAGAEREIIGPSPIHSRGANTAFPKRPGEVSVNESGRTVEQDHPMLTAPATEAAKQWEGWGTALKPSYEGWWLCRKPFREKTAAANVLEWGTGGINVDGCRVEGRERTEYGLAKATRSKVSTYGEPSPSADFDSSKGRWPPNLLLSEEAAAEMDEQSGTKTSGKSKRRHEAYSGESDTGFLRGFSSPDNQYDDTGGASRFFPVFRYQAKAKNSERPKIWLPDCNCETIKPCPSLQKDTTGSSSADGRSWNMSGSGNRLTDDQYPLGTTSITETATSSTMTSPTSSLSPSLSTRESIQGANSEMESGGSPARTAGNSSPSPSSTGTSVPKAGCSTDDAARVTSKWSSSPRDCDGCGKPWKSESHATVKPLPLLRWMVRLVTPPNGTCLDLFAGSGTTGEACLDEGFNCILIEREPDYIKLIRERLGRREPTLWDSLWE